MAELPVNYQTLENVLKTQNIKTATLSKEIDLLMFFRFVPCCDPCWTESGRKPQLQPPGPVINRKTSSWPRQESPGAAGEPQPGWPPHDLLVYCYYFLLYMIFHFYSPSFLVPVPAAAAAATVLPTCWREVTVPILVVVVVVLRRVTGV